MNMSFYTGSVGARQQQQRMNVQANNIANVNNYGFKAERASFYRLMHRDMPSLDEGVVRGTGSRVEMAGTDFSTSGYAETGRRFDFAIEGDGFFALYDPASGEISFTRDGAFMMAQFLVPAPEGSEQAYDEVWRLSDNEGRCVLDNMGNFIVIDPQDRDADLDVGVYDYMVYDGMQHLDSQRFIPIEKNGDLYLGTGKVIRGYLEMSNVDLAQEFIKVIESQRAYSYALRMVQTSDEVEQTINGLRN